MYAGQVAELSKTSELFDRPLHPYSQGLLGAFPSIRGPRVRLTGIPGSPPNLANPPRGCRFAPRCPSAEPRCTAAAVPLHSVNGSLVRCVLVEDGS
jgi:peptide/nickel transport system ATP-binding protein